MSPARFFKGLVFIRSGVLENPGRSHKRRQSGFSRQSVRRRRGDTDADVVNVGSGKVFDDFVSLKFAKVYAVEQK